MSIGLPGSGIGGVFYLASALAMPFVTLRRALHDPQGAQWKVVARQFTLAACIVISLWLTAWSIDLLLAQLRPDNGLHAAIGNGAKANVPHVFRIASAGITLGTLACVLLVVQVLRVAIRPRVRLAAVAVDPPVHRDAA